MLVDRIEIHLAYAINLLLTLCIASVLLISAACTFHGSLRDDFYTPPNPLQETKLPLGASLIVEAQNIKATGAFGVGVDIGIKSGLTKALQLELSKVFDEVVLADSAQSARPGDVLIHSNFRNRVQLDTMTGTADTDWEIEFNFRESATRIPLSQLTLKERTHYSPSGEMRFASFVTGLCFFICLPLTAPWMAHIAGTNTLELIEEALSQELRKLPEAIRNDYKLLAYARGESASGLLTKSQLTPYSSGIIDSDVDTPPHVSQRHQKNAYAIVIGVEKYRGQLPAADFAARDAKIVARYLTKVMGYQEENVMLLLDQNASRADIEKYIESWLRNRTDKDSSVFIYYSGHGAPDPKNGEAYLVPYDADPSFLENTGYPLKRLYGALGTLPVKDSLVVLDSCFSGLGGRSLTAKGMRPMFLSLENPALLDGKTSVISASAGDQAASTYLQKGHGLLTYYFLKGLQGAADIDKDGSIDLSELFAYVKPEVERVSKREFNNTQTPQLVPADRGKQYRLIEALKVD